MNINVTQLKKLQKDYVERSKTLRRDIKSHVRRKKYIQAMEADKYAIIYAIAARDLRDLINGKNLYAE